MFCLLHQTTMLFDKHEHKYTAKNHEADNSFCACPQIYSVRPDSAARMRCCVRAARGGCVPPSATKGTTAPLFTAR